MNQRLAYVALSLGQYDAQIYTNDKTQLTNTLSRDVSHRSAIELSRENVSERAPKPAMQIEAGYSQ